MNNTLADRYHNVRVRVCSRNVVICDVKCSHLCGALDFQLELIQVKWRFVGIYSDFWMWNMRGRERERKREVQVERKKHLGSAQKERERERNKCDLKRWRITSTRNLIKKKFRWKEIGWHAKIKVLRHTCDIFYFRRSIKSTKWTP